MKAILLTVLGLISLALGAIGLFVPILPTTPFVLLAAGCFAASNEKLYHWLLKSRHFGAFIDNYRNKNGVPQAVKRNALLFLWGGLVCSAVIFPRPLVWGILLVVGVGVTIHILSLKTANSEAEVAKNEKCAD